MNMICWSVQQLEAFLERLAEESWDVIGPVIRDGAMVYDEMRALPVGVGDEQEAGRYRLTDRNDQSRFGYNLGPATWKQFLFPPAETLFTVRDDVIASSLPEPRKMAFVGVRACELAAIQVQDRVFLGGEHEDAHYRQRRNNILIVAVDCAQAAPTCFCTANDDGPSVGGGADVVLTEINPQDPEYLVRFVSDRAESLIAEIGGSEVTPAQREQAKAAVQQTAAQITRQLPREGLREDLYAALGHPHWDDIAGRCLGCGNCTQVCPTCFCSTTAEVYDLESGDVSHDRVWDSCFTEMHSYTHGGSIHRETRTRYRQWLTHKLASWEDQFDMSGCTGCGRCISWCPVGIDLTLETRLLIG